MIVSGVMEYFDNIWNLVDIGCYSLFVFYCLTKMSESPNVNERSPNTLHLAIISTIFIQIRFISQLNVFDRTRNLVRMTIEVFKDMISFLSILCVAVIGASLIFFLIRRDAKTEYMYG